MWSIKIDKDRDHHPQDRIANALWALAHEFHIFNQHAFAAIDFNLKGVDAPMISPTPVGGSAKYRLSLVPSNAVALQSGPTVSSSNSLVVVTQDPSDPFLLTATADASVTDASYDLKADGVNGAGNPITHTFTIPLAAAPPPQAVDFDLNDA